jgi:hypothetical protein
MFSCGGSAVAGATSTVVPTKTGKPSNRRPGQASGASASRDPRVSVAHRDAVFPRFEHAVRRLRATIQACGYGSPRSRGRPRGKSGHDELSRNAKRARVMCHSFRPEEIVRAWGMPGAPAAPAASRGKGKTTRASQPRGAGSARHSRTRMVLTVSFVLSLVNRALLPPSPAWTREASSPT